LSKKNGSMAVKGVLWGKGRKKKRSSKKKRGVS